MFMSDFVEVCFEEALVVLKREVLLVDDVHTLFGCLGEYIELIRRFRVENNLRREQEAIILYNVCKDELGCRGCVVEEFGDFDV